MQGIDAGPLPRQTAGRPGFSAPDRRSPPFADSLVAAAGLVAEVLRGKSLASWRPRESECGDRAAILDLSHGALRGFGRYPAIVRRFSTRDIRVREVEALLYCALHALERGRRGEHVVVDQAVRATAILGQRHAQGYVNSLLRRFLRERRSLDAALRHSEEAQWQLPTWWLKRLRDAYPKGWEDCARESSSRSPMTLRVNRRSTTVEHYLTLLHGRGIEAAPAGRDAIRLPRPVAVDRLPRFSDGAVSVQDLSAQRAAHIIDLAPGQRVLDACAAPGGKAAHFVETCDVELTALDLDPDRVSRIVENFSRLRLAATILQGDCEQPDSWWDGRAFDRVLADLPCTASGVVRRHPDLKWLRRAGDVTAFARRQQRMLSALWGLLRPGGKLLYSTCSVFQEENEFVISAFLAERRDALRLRLPDGGPAQLLPDANQDGFFYALLEKRAQ